tara:strand:+ start:1093 stop:1425 length:333 start_codon:yes stop_codon:yes gene_type:complete
MKKVELKYLMQDVTRSLIGHMRDEGYLDRVNTTEMFRSGALEYDRNKFIRQNAPYDESDDVTDRFDADIESLAIQLLQMVHYGRILYLDDNGKDIRINKPITEGFTPKTI